jgi:hypothetical protein
MSVTVSLGELTIRKQERMKSPLIRKADRELGAIRPELRDLEENGKVEPMMECDRCHAVDSASVPGPM